MSPKPLDHEQHISIRYLPNCLDKAKHFTNLTFHSAMRSIHNATVDPIETAWVNAVLVVSSPMRGVELLEASHQMR